MEAFISRNAEAPPLPGCVRKGLKPTMLGSIRIYSF